MADVVAYSHDIHAVAGPSLLGHFQHNLSPKRIFPAHSHSNFNNSSRLVKGNVEPLTAGRDTIENRVRPFFKSSCFSMSFSMNPTCEMIKQYLQNIFGNGNIEKQC